ncbi:hypothetical protein AAF712_016432 [Marasmius tenuissimus]|uniref:Uncharacterized protein n=1 Tax=Marasmius tenuissimus TaxID=585030 RepID=A0ABR2Z7H3_9AGAR
MPEEVLGLMAQVNRASLESIAPKVSPDDNQIAVVNGLCVLEKAYLSYEKPESIQIIPALVLSTQTIHRGLFPQRVFYPPITTPSKMRLSLSVLTFPIVTLAAPSAKRIAQLFAPVVAGDGASFVNLSSPNVAWTLTGSVLSGTHNFTELYEQRYV